MTHATAANGFDLEQNDFQAEQAVLGAMIQSPTALADCLDILRPEDFYRPAHQEIFAVIRRMDGEGRPVDPITLLERLDAAHVKYGGATYLHDLIAAVPSVANATWYAERIRDMAGRRTLLAAGRNIAAIALSPELDAADRADRAGRAVDAATARDADSGAVPVGDLLPGFLESLQSGDPGPTIPTGLVDMDALFAGGLRPGELVTVGARPGVGKSAFLLGVAVQAAVKEQRPVVFWSLEMSRKEILQRIVSSVARVPMYLLRKHELTDSDWKRIENKFPEITAAPLRINDHPYLKLHDLRAELRGMRHRGNPAELAVLDYLQLMTSDSKAENRQQEVAELARGLKLMAKEFDVPIIAASQLNRGSEARADRRPMLADLRESGAVEQDSDVVVLLYREDAFDPESRRAGEIDLIVAKHRNGPTATITAAFQGHFSRIVDMAPDPGQRSHSKDR